MAITLEPHPARQKNPRTGELVPCIFNQQQVLVDGVRVAYCGTEPGQAISFIRPYPELYKQEVKAFVEEHVGEVSRMGEPPAVPDALLRGEEPDEEDEELEYEDEE